MKSSGGRINCEAECGRSETLSGGQRLGFSRRSFFGEYHSVGRYEWGAFVMHEWKRQLDLLVEETMAFVRTVGNDASRKTYFPQTGAPREEQGIPGHPEPQLPMAAEVPTPKYRLDGERDVIQRRVADFKANQRKFQKDREEYCARTMANARATRWTPRSRDNDKPLKGPSR
jgi:hypothetical protein